MTITIFVLMNKINAIPLSCELFCNYRRIYKYTNLLQPSDKYIISALSSKLPCTLVNDLFYLDLFLACTD